MLTETEAGAVFRFYPEPEAARQGSGTPIKLRGILHIAKERCHVPSKSIKNSIFSVFLG